MADSGMIDAQQLEALVDSGQIDTVLVCFPDLYGRLLGKRVTGRFFLESVHEEMHVCDYLLACDMEMEPVPGYGVASWDKGYGDFTVKPDMGTLRLIPWLEKTALVLGDCLGHGDGELAHAPRTILKTQLAKGRSMNFVAKVGSELELYVFDESYEACREKGYRGLATAGWYIEDYHILQTTREEPLVRAIRNGMDGAGVPVEFSKGEWGPGQEEINLRYAEALEMADRHTIYKNGAKEIAMSQGKAITFMAKFDTKLAGNSCHVHSSLWDAATDEPIFYDAAGEHGMSKLFRHYLAGQLALAADYTLLLGPTINSYKRFQAGSFAPTRIAWSMDNRTAGYRLVGRGKGLRGECRIPGGDCNPYLAFAALIGAGLYGIENELELEPEMTGNIYENEAARDVPKTLREAIERFEQSKPMRGILGDDVVDHYAHAGRWEQREHDRCVTDLERIRNFERI